MNKEHSPLPELDPAIVADFAAIFLSRTDYYPRQKADGGYFVVDKPAHLGVVMAHLKGAITIGAYALSLTDEAKWLCFDADDVEHWKQLQSMAQALTSEEVSSYLELSRRGGHLWLFTPPTKGKDIRRFGRQLLDEFRVPIKGNEHPTGVEMYPKQDTLSGPGSLVRLPFGFHRVTGKRYSFVAVNGERLAPTIRGQLNALASPKIVPQEFLNAVLARVPEEPPTPRPQFTKQEIRDGLPSQRIKEAISLEQFVSQYVKLDSRGKGHCPFHDDEHESFQIGEGKYGTFWSCYAECGEPHGGDIIHFWQRMRQRQGQDDSFVPTISELAGMLLK